MLCVDTNSYKLKVDRNIMGGHVKNECDQLGQGTLKLADAVN